MEGIRSLWNISSGASGYFVIMYFKIRSALLILLKGIPSSKDRRMKIQQCRLQRGHFSV